MDSLIQETNSLVISTELVHPISENGPDDAPISQRDAFDISTHTRSILISQSQDSLLDYDFVAFTDCIMDQAIRSLGTLEFLSNSIADTGLCEEVGAGRSFVVRRASVHHSSVNNFGSGAALKTLRASHFADPREKALSYRSLIQEIKILRHHKIKGHPSFLDCWNVWWGVDIEHPGLLHPTIRGEFAYLGTLSNFLQLGQFNITYQVIRQLILDVAYGLWALHRSSIAHGDLKPDNILVTLRPCGHGRTSGSSCFAIAKLSDFGFSIDTNSGPEYQYLVGYTPLFAAPEATTRLQRTEICATDIYSFGLTIWSAINKGRNILELLPSKSGNLEKDYEIFDDLKISGKLCDEIQRQIGSFDRPPKVISEICDMIQCTLQNNPNRRDLLPIILMLNVGVECPKAEVNLSELDPDIYQELPQKTIFPLGGALINGNSTFLSQVRTQLRDDLERLALRRQPSKTPRYIDAKSWRFSRIHANRESQAAFACANIRVGGFFGCERSLPEAFKWLLISANHGFVLAKAVASIVGQQWDIGALGDYDKEWLYEAASNGCLPALKNLKAHGDVRFDACYQESCTEFWVQSYEIPEDMVRLLMDNQKRKDDWAGLLYSTVVIGQFETTWLHGAVMAGNLELVRYLVEENEYSVSWPNSRLETPFLLACRSRHWNIATYLLFSGADPATVDINNRGALHWLALSLPEDREAILLAEICINSGAKIHQMADPEDLVDADTSCFIHRQTYGTPLHQAISAENIGIVKLLLTAGASPLVDISFSIEVHSSPLGLAVKLRMPEIVKLLLNSIQAFIGCDRAKIGLMYSTDRPTKAPLIGLAFEESNLPVLSHYYHAPYHDDLLIETLDLLLDYGFQMNGTGVSGAIQTVMISSREIRAMEYLCKRGFQVSLATSMRIHEPSEYPEKGDQVPGESPMLADDREIFDILDRYGNVVLAYSGPNNMGILSYCPNNATYFTRKLLESGANPNISFATNSAITGLFRVLMRHQFDVAEILIDYGADINFYPEDLSNLLSGSMLAIFLRYRGPSLYTYKILNYLLTHSKANVGFIINPLSNLTIWHTFAEAPIRGSEDPLYTAKIFQLLLRFFPGDAKINAEFYDLGITALHFAVRQAKPILVKLLLEAGANPDFKKVNEAVSRSDMEYMLEDGAMSTLDEIWGILAMQYYSPREIAKYEFFDNRDDARKYIVKDIECYERRKKDVRSIFGFD
ncbi:hypothetical protein TWF694_004692 [Orbilia ellipsospora]|uniref:Protein kinase domain-containing protein n=1 Tax=Orbilia ellipsospora TaxID=2528407 RepID=A0AAV9WW21_9PEZI